MDRVEIRMRCVEAIMAANDVTHFEELINGVIALEQFILSADDPNPVEGASKPEAAATIKAAA